MTKKFFPYAIIVLALSIISSLVIGQTTKPATAKPMVKFKPPVVKSYLGDITGKEVVAGVEEAKRLIVLPLKIVDAKNVEYNITSYQFSYKRIGIKEDEETGKTSPAGDMVSKQFTETPLPAIWQSNIIETLHKGETLYFFDIIVIDKQGRRFFAPDLKITIQ